MTYEEERKAKAALKVVAGTARCVSGALLMFGHGAMSIVLKTPGAQCSVGQALIRSGEQTVKDGMKEWNK